MSDMYAPSNEQQPSKDAPTSQDEKKGWSARFKWKLTLLTCLIAYAILAIFAFLETRKLIWANLYSVQGTTLYVPLVLCVPPSLEFRSGESWAIDTSTGASPCREMDYLIRSSGVSLILSAAAVIMFFILDILVSFCPKKWRGPFNPSTITGMGLFLIFILLQAGVSTGALFEQVIFWVKHLRSVIDTIVGTGQGGTVRVTEARSYADAWVMAFATYFAFVLCAGILIECILLLCQAQKKDDEEGKTEQQHNTITVPSGIDAASTFSTDNCKWAAATHVTAGDATSVASSTSSTHKGDLSVSSVAAAWAVPSPRRDHVDEETGGGEQGEIVFEAKSLADGEGKVKKATVEAVEKPLSVVVESSDDEEDVESQIAQSSSDKPNDKEEVDENPSQGDKDVEASSSSDTSGAASISHPPAPVAPGLASDELPADVKSSPADENDGDNKLEASQEDSQAAAPQVDPPETPRDERHDPKTAHKD